MVTQGLLENGKDDALALLDILEVLNDQQEIADMILELLEDNQHNRARIIADHHRAMLEWIRDEMRVVLSS